MGNDTPKPPTGPWKPPVDPPSPPPHLVSLEQELRQELEGRFLRVRDIEAQVPARTSPRARPGRGPAPAQSSLQAWRRELEEAYRALLDTTTELGELRRRLRRERAGEG